MRRLGLILLLLAALVWLGAAFLAPFPTSAGTFDAKVRAEGTVDASRVLLSAGVAYVHSYDAQNDTTYFRVAMCSHSLCGPAVAVKGDLRLSGLHVPLLLDPVDDTISLVQAPAPDEGRPTYFQSRETAEAYSTLFETRSPWPVFLPRLLSIALAGIGLGLALRPRWITGSPGLLGSLMGILVARGPSFIILSQLAVLPLALAALIAMGIELAKRKTAWVAGSIVLFAIIELVASFVAFAHFAPDGGD